LPFVYRARKLCRDKAWLACNSLVVCGGVASNDFIRQRLTKVGVEFGMKTIFPSPSLCTDNAVMIAWAAIEHLNKMAQSHPDFVVEDISLNLEKVKYRHRWLLGDETIDSSMFKNIRLPGEKIKTYAKR